VHHAAGAGMGFIDHLGLWAGFLGAWLLVAGPLHQARVELGEEELQRDRYAAAIDEVGPPPHTSIWWWLLPPLHLWISHRRRDRWQREVWSRLPAEDFEALASFMTKARGWMLVGVGGLLIGVKETHLLVAGYEWPDWLFWLLIVAMTLLCVANTVAGAALQGRVDKTADRSVSTAPGTASS
jgi:hypothetical protein